MRIYYTNAEQTEGVIELDSGSQASGPLPPNDGYYRAVYDKFLVDGGEVEPYVAPLAE